MWAGGVAALSADAEVEAEAARKFLVSILSYFILFTFILESRSLSLCGLFSLPLLPFL